LTFTLNTYGRAREDALVRLAETVGDIFLAKPNKEPGILTEQKSRRC
jgi:hypothetical protein